MIASRVRRSRLVTSRGAGLLSRLRFGGSRASHHRRGREKENWGGCDHADGTPAAYLVAWRGAPGRCTAGVAGYRHCAERAMLPKGHRRHNAVPCTPRRASEVALFGGGDGTPGRPRPIEGRCHGISGMPVPLSDSYGQRAGRRRNRCAPSTAGRGDRRPRRTLAFGSDACCHGGGGQRPAPLPPPKNPLCLCVSVVRVLAQTDRTKTRSRIDLSRAARPQAPRCDRGVARRLPHR